MVSKKLIKFKTLLKQNLIPLVIVLTWFTGNFTYFYLNTNDLKQTAQILFFFKEYGSPYGNFYLNFSEFIIFGLIFSLITIDLFRKYNPSHTSKELAKRYKNHVVIIGYTHIGQRIANYLDKRGEDYVIVENNRELVEDLIEGEKPVVNESPLKLKTLKEAGVQYAKAVYVMDDTIKLQLVTNHYIRSLNEDCKLVCRIFEDEIAEVIEDMYGPDNIISTSRYASDTIMNKIKESGSKKVLMIGMNHISKRLMNKLNKEEIYYQVVEGKKETLNKCLEDVNLEEIDCAINLETDLNETILAVKKIREVNEDCKIIARFFLDSVAKILEKPPFSAEVISSSMDTLEIMKKEGMLGYSEKQTKN